MTNTNTTQPRVCEQADDPLRDLPDFDAKVQARAALDRQADERALFESIDTDEFRKLCDAYHCASQSELEEAYDAIVRFVDEDFAQQATPPQQDAPEAPTLWRCFHCEESFTDRDKAALHFGYSERQAPACKLDEKYLREMEAEVGRYREEDTDLHRQIAGQSARLEAAKRSSEEQGYARGLKDARLLPTVAAPEAPAGEQKCNWPSCLPEHEQDKLAQEVLVSMGETPAAASPEAWRDCPDCEATGRISPSELCARCNQSGILPATTASAREVLAGETYTVSKKLMETVWTALTHYSYPSTYSAPRIGGVLEGCPRGAVPTPRELTEWAEHALREIRKEIPAQGVATATAPSSTASASVDTLEFARIFGAVLQADRKRVKSGPVADPEWMEAYGALIAYIDGRTAGTAGDAVQVLQSLKNPYNERDHGTLWYASAHAWDMGLVDAIRAIRTAAPTPQSPVGGEGRAK